MNWESQHTGWVRKKYHRPLKNHEQKSRPIMVKIFIWLESVLCCWCTVNKWDSLKIPISRYERLNTTTLETFLSTKLVFFLNTVQSIWPTQKTVVYLSCKWNNGRKCNIIRKGNTWAFRWYDIWSHKKKIKILQK